MKTSAQREWPGHRQKYRNPDYEDGEVEGLMKYFGMTDYVEFVDFIRRARRASA